MRSSFPTLAFGLALALAPGLRAAEVPAPHSSPDPHAGHFGSGGHHGNPSDLPGYIASQEEPGRAEWQKPEEVLKALGLAPGQTACDVGTGPGYFSLRLARALGERGHVYAVDVEPGMLDALRERLGPSGLRNVTPVLALGDDPLLPDGACDLVLIVDTFHHFDDGVAYLRRLQRALRPGGRLANIDFHKRETPVGPPLERRVSREAFLDAATSAGYALAQEHDFLPYQYFVVLRPR